MGTSLKTQKNIKLVGVLALAGAGVVSCMFIHWILGVLCFVGAGYFFWGLMKFMAGNGQRF